MYCASFKLWQCSQTLLSFHSLAFLELSEMKIIPNLTFCTYTIHFKTLSEQNIRGLRRVMGQLAWLLGTHFGNHLWCLLINKIMPQCPKVSWFPLGTTSDAYYASEFRRFLIAQFWQQFVNGTSLQMRVIFGANLFDNDIFETGTKWIP